MNIPLSQCCNHTSEIIVPFLPGHRMEIRTWKYMQSGPVTRPSSSPICRQLHHTLAWSPAWHSGTDHGLGSEVLGDRHCHTLNGWPPNSGVFSSVGHKGCFVRRGTMNVTFLIPTTTLCSPDSIFRTFVTDPAHSCLLGLHRCKRARLPNCRWPLGSPSSLW